MENILYQYHFNIIDFLPNLIPLFVGIGFLCNSIVIIRSKEKVKGWEGFIQSFFKIVGFIVAPLCAFLFTASMINMTKDNSYYIGLLKDNNLNVVEGYVESRTVELLTKTVSI